MRLLESSARRQRRRAGMVVSVVAHTAVIALAVVATARGTPAPPEVVRDLIYVVPPPPPAPEPDRAAPATPSSAPTAPGGTPTLPTPDLSRIPDVIPPPGAAMDPAIDPSRGLFGPPGGLTGAVVGGAGSGGVDRGSPLAAAEVERQVLLVGAPPRPRYPETLRQAGVEGRVVVRFVVDTAGRVERGSVAVTSSSHALFTAAVEPLVAGLRFRPAEAGGRRVRQLVEMPFEFVLGGR
jgi:protein TonB